MTELNKIKETIPAYVYRVADKLVDNGYEAFLVGGAVRDLLIDREPKDYDLATNALPDQIEKIFPRSVTTNARFGTVLVIIEDETGERFDVEVTTYRSEEDYIGGRWPSKVDFSDDITKDLSRRDFTINAMALNLKDIFEPSATLEEVLLDPFLGIEDLEANLIRAVRDPLERLGEDGLRAFKACRLASELGYGIEVMTMKAITETLHIAKKISIERIRDEFIKMLKHSVKPSVGIEYMRKTGLLEIFLPELLETIGITQPEWHEDDVYQHSLKTMDIAEDSIKIAALLHDIGKAHTQIKDENGIHFYGHDVEGARMVKEILTRMRFSSAEVARNVSLVRWHMFYYPSSDWRKNNEINENLLNEKDAGWTDSAIRRFVKNVGENLIEDLFKLRIADAASNPKSLFDPVEIQALEQRISEVRAQDLVIKITDLDINGNDLKALGITSGPMIGKILNELLERVMDEPLLNKKEALLGIVPEIRTRFETE